MEKQIQNNELGHIAFAFAEMENEMTENLEKKRKKKEFLKNKIGETISRLNDFLEDYYDLT